jgi:uncharacterized protein (DUF885 family)
MKKQFSLCLLSAALLASFVPAAPAFAQAAAKVSGLVSSQARRQLDQLADAYYEANARFEPVDATQSGDNRFDDLLGMAIDPKVRARHFAGQRAFLRRLRAIDRQLLDRGAQINYDILDYELASGAELRAAFPRTCCR